MEEEKKEGKLRALLFDFDGTLVDSHHLIFHSYQAFLDARGCSVDWEQFRQLDGYSLREGFVHVRERYGLAESVEELVADYSTRLLSSYRDQAMPFEGADAFLHWARERGLQLAIVTAGLRSLVELFCERVEWSDLFETVVTSEDVTFSKPHPEPYELALQQLGLEPHEALAIEDSLQGMRSARAARLHTIQVLWSKNAVPPNQLEGTSPIRCWSELTGLIEKG